MDLSKKVSRRVVGEKHTHLEVPSRRTDGSVSPPKIPREAPSRRTDGSVSPPKIPREEPVDAVYDETLKIVQAFIISGSSKVTSSKEKKKGMSMKAHKIRKPVFLMANGGGRHKTKSESGAYDEKKAQEDKYDYLDLELGDDIASDGICEGKVQGTSCQESKPGTPGAKTEVDPKLIQAIGERMREITDAEDEKKKNEYQEVIWKLAKETVTYATFKITINSLLKNLSWTDEKRQVALVIQLAKQAYEASASSADAALTQNVTRFIMESFSSLKTGGLASFFGATSDVET